MGLIFPRNCSKANFVPVWYEAHRCAVIHYRQQVAEMPVTWAYVSSLKELDNVTLGNPSCLCVKGSKNSVSKRRTNKTPFLWAQTFLPYFPGTKLKTKENLS